MSQDRNLTEAVLEEINAEILAFEERRYVALEASIEELRCRWPLSSGQHMISSDELAAYFEEFWLPTWDKEKWAWGDMGLAVPTCGFWVTSS